MDLADSQFDSPKSNPLPGTVKFYQRHLFVCTPNADWPAHIEADDGFLQAMWQAITSRAEDMHSKVKLTACHTAGHASEYDILVFPDQIRYQAVKVSHLPILVEDHLVGGQVSGNIAHQSLGGHHIFVCTHGTRDPRCGVCGPPLVESFNAALDARGLTDEVTIWEASHVGGHKYAGNVLIYPRGDWYGYVTPDDVPRIVDQHILNGQVIPGLWRGRMGLTPAQQIQLAADWSSSESAD